MTCSPARVVLAAPFWEGSQKRPGLQTRHTATKE